MSLIPNLEHHDSNADELLAVFSLSTATIHNCFRLGLNHARSRTQLAPPGSQANDIRFDASEQFGLMMAPEGWTLTIVEGQPRYAHPDGLIEIVFSSARRVGLPDPRQNPITGPKGPATHNAIDQQGIRQTPLDLPEFEENIVASAAGKLRMMLYELTPYGLNLELAQPAGYGADGRVTKWSNQIVIPPMRLDGDFSMFSDEPNGPDDLDVPVIAR